EPLADGKAGFEAETADPSAGHLAGPRDLGNLANPTPVVEDVDRCGRGRVDGEHLARELVSITGSEFLLGCSAERLVEVIVEFVDERLLAPGLLGRVGMVAVLASDTLTLPESPLDLALLDVRRRVHRRLIPWESGR